MAGPYTDEQIINFIIELRTRPNNPLTENEAIAAVQDTYGISDERISQIENLLFQQSSAFFNPIKFAATSEDPLIDTTTKKTVKDGVETEREMFDFSNVEERKKEESKREAASIDEFVTFIVEDEDFPEEWKELFYDTNPNAEQNKEKLSNIYKDLNDRLDRKYIEDEDIFFPIDQDLIDDRNELVRDNDLVGLLEFDAMENLDVFNLGTRELTLDEVLKVKADAQGYYFKQDISYEELLTSFNETYTQVAQQEAKLGININTKPYQDDLINDLWTNLYNIEPPAEKRPPNKEERFDIIDIKNQNVFTNPQYITLNDYFNFTFTIADELGYIPPTIKSLLLDPNFPDNIINTDFSESTTKALSVLNELGIEPRENVSYFTEGVRTYPIDQVDDLLADLVNDHYEKISPYYIPALENGNPEQFYRNLVTESPQKYIGIAGERAKNNQRRQNLFEENKWDFTKSIAENVKSIMATEQTTENGEVFDFNPNNEMWPPELIKFFKTNNIKKVSGQLQRKIIATIENSAAGRAYAESLKGPNKQGTLVQGFAVFNELIDYTGEDFKKYEETLFVSLDQSARAEFSIDKQSVTKMKQHAKNAAYVIVPGVELGDIQISKLAAQLQDEDTWLGAVNKQEFVEYVKELGEESKFQGPFSYDTNTVSGAESALKDVLDRYSVTAPSAYNKLSAEDKNILISGMIGKGSIQEVMGDPEARSVLDSLISKGDELLSQDIANSFAAGIDDFVIGAFKQKGLIDANTTPEFYNHIQKNVAPVISFKAQMSGISNSSDLDTLINEMISGKDAENNPINYGLPAYDIYQSDYDRQLGVTAADVLSGAALPPSAPGGPTMGRVEDVSAKYDLSNILPQLQPYAQTRPEFAAFMAEEMQKGTFKEDWQKAATAQPLEDRGAFLEERGEEREYWSGRLSDAQAAYDANPSQENADALQTAQEADAKAQQHYEIETGKTKFALVPPKEDADDPYQYGVSGKLITDPTLTEEERLASYYDFIGRATPEKPITETERAEALEKAENLANMMPTVDDVFDYKIDPETGDPIKGSGATELAQLMTTTPQTTSEFFQSQLPGFEKRYKESSFFKQEEDRIKREQETEESQRRRQLRQRPTGMSVFTRARR